MSAAEAREPRKIRRARTRATYWALRRSRAVTSAEQAGIAYDEMRAALARPEVTERQRERGWAEFMSAADRITASVTPREFTRELHSVDLTAADAAKAQTRMLTRAR
jgi:hypothetical protein